MAFEKGNNVGAATRFRGGVSGNPAGRPYFPQTKPDAIRAVLGVAEQVLTDPAMLDVWREKLRAKWQEDPFFVLRQLLPFMPKEVFTLSREIGGSLQQMTVSQLRQIAATLPHGETNEGEAIEIGSSDDDATQEEGVASAGGSEATPDRADAPPPPADAAISQPRNTPGGCSNSSKTVTLPVTMPEIKDDKTADNPVNSQYVEDMPSDGASEDEELRFV